MLGVPKPRQMLSILSVRVLSVVVNACLRGLTLRSRSPATVERPLVFFEGTVHRGSSANNDNRTESSGDHATSGSAVRNRPRPCPISTGQGASAYRSHLPSMPCCFGCPAMASRIARPLPDRECSGRYGACDQGPTPTHQSETTAHSGASCLEWSRTELHSRPVLLHAATSGRV
ncbi:hypothetical protein R5R35_005026 [Gryllus longicercus]|uniref:Uncharacterized protein n=1 Tax=Gryllus longicercus TaxID=2509291 RepID=A0AAN9VRP1_9ORTH